MSLCPFSFKAPYHWLSTTSVRQSATELLEKLVPASIKVVATILTNGEAKDSDRLKAAELLTKWGGLRQTSNQPQQAAELTLKQYLVALETKPNVSHN